MTEIRWDFTKCIEELRKFSDEREWRSFHDPKNLAMLLCSEAGELLAELRWIDNAAADDYVKEDAVRRRIREEMADVMIAILLLADRMNTDLSADVLAKIETNRTNYPAYSSIGAADRPR